MISVVKVLVFSLVLSAFRQIFVSEHGWVGVLSPMCDGALQADPCLSFTSADYGQMTVLLCVKYCEGFAITFLVLWAPFWLPAFAHASPDGFTVCHEQLVLFL